MNLADRIQLLRKSRGISQDELADKVGVSRQAVSKWESEQSTPELDKIIIISEYFDVTIDYLLKGIEAPSQQNDDYVDARIFVVISTALNFIGLIVSCAAWYEEHSRMAAVIAFIFLAVSGMIFCIGQTVATKHADTAKRIFFALNIWVVAFLLLSLPYNSLFTHTLAPYPLQPGPSFTFPMLPVIINPGFTYLLFWIVYVAICLTVTLMQIRRRRKK